MGTMRFPDDVKLITGLISNDDSLFQKIRTRLEREFGHVDFESESLTFEHTDYYGDEMGENLKRRFLSFARPIPLKGAHMIKVRTNRFEKDYSLSNRRAINIDPGYLNLSKLVLFTTKDYSHRVHIADAIFAEVALYFKDGTFNPFPWTYPDFKTKDYIDIFNSIREIYKTGRQR
ncbi:MAG: hypothetical protein A2987_05680 [Omnitrophica bacterium RIFCSPLOWO2_01_FULL_45_10]|nr:MAG: hypothetical protein A2987_05680 [Omnitrophica bacterium RIFCSPLOWO2_01_FULL_45_10]